MHQNVTIHLILLGFDTKRSARLQMNGLLTMREINFFNESLNLQNSKSRVKIEHKIAWENYIYSYVE
jgi:hypothetical protein